VIITRRKWLRQPSGFLNLDYSNPLIAGARQVYVPSNDLLNVGNPNLNAGASGTWVKSGTVPVADSGLAMGAKPVGASGYLYTPVQIYELTNVNPWTLAALVSFPTSPSSAQSICTIALSPGDPTHDRSISVESNSGYFLAGSLYNGSTRTVYDTTPVVASKLYAVVVSAITGGTLAIYVNGLLKGSLAIAGAGSPGYGSADLVMGYGSPAGATQGTNANSALLTRFDGINWGGGEAQAFAENPWQLFAPRTRRLYFAAHSGTSFSGTPGLGSLVKTGKINGLVIGYEFVPTVGAMVKTGKNPALTRAFNFAPGVGSMVKTGEIPTLTRRFNFAPGVGSIPKTGEVPALTVAFKMQPAPGAMVKTGHAPLLYAPFYTGTGSMVKTGYAPTLTISGGPTAGQLKHSWFVKGIGVKTKGLTHSQVDSDSGDTP
jgi:uncharacterized protein YodC (DUF2158 family)